ncbi:MAG: hypothetical protein HQK49_21810 [Oligoflexia bacterium]|nr:hypothetical protein [Oligoflexia bacterium]
MNKISQFKKIIRNFYLKKEGVKERIRIKKLFITVIVAFFILIVCAFVTPTVDSSFFRQSYQPLRDRSSSSELTKKNGEQEQSMKLPIKKLSEVELKEKEEAKIQLAAENKLLQKSNKRRAKVKKVDTADTENDDEYAEGKNHNDQKINYSAPIVIVRDETNDSTIEKLPVGSSFIGKLLTPIDTRINNTLVKIELPFGAKNKRTGTTIIPKGTILFAQVQYLDDSDRVFLSINKGVTKDDVEFDLQAQGLSSDDFNPGVIGEYHSNLSSRLASNFGWSMSGAAAEVLQEKQVIGTTEGAVVLPKNTVENALLEGTKRTINNESGRAVEELNRKRAYVTVPAGKHLIVSLIQTLSANKLEQGGLY